MNPLWRSCLKDCSSFEKTCLNWSEVVIVIELDYMKVNSRIAFINYIYR